MQIRILIVNGSPRLKNNTGLLLERAAAGIQKINGIELKSFSFAGKSFAGCRGTCYSYCGKNGCCVEKDNFNEFLGLFLWADGIIWAVPTYHAGPPAQVKAVLDRLGNVIFSFTKGMIPRFNKACGVITHGSSEWGGQELTAQFMINSITQLKCLTVAGDSPKTNMAVIGYAPTWEPGSIAEDKTALAAAETLGQRVAETAKIIQEGTLAISGQLDERYYAKELIEKIHFPSEEG